jgi:hypothetical protein
MITEMAGLKENSHIEAYPTMILTLGKCDNPPATWPEELVNWYRVQDRSLTLLPKRILLEVSPSSLDSVELVARLLRRIIAEADWPELPIKANLPAGIDTASAGISITVHKAFKTAPSLEQIEQIADLLKDATFKIGSIEQRLNDIVRIQRGRVGNNAKDLAQEKGRLQTELLALKENLNVWQKLLEELNRIRSIILPAMTCPCCGHQTSQPPQASMFFCSYGPSCKTRWGKRADAMGQMHVFLMPNGEDPILQSEKENPIDRYGSDFI